MDKINNHSKKKMSLFAFLITSANCEAINYGFKAGCKIKVLWITESGSVLPPKSAASVQEAFMIAFNPLVLGQRRAIGSCIIYVIYAVFFGL